MKDYLTGICANCGKEKTKHSIYDKCLIGGRTQLIQQPFSDSGEKRLKDAAPELLEALIEAKQTIKNWHNMTGDKYWDIYEKYAPEMKRLNSAIANALGKDAQP